jgi:hypothetical protein
MACVPIATREARAYLFYKAPYIQTVPTGCVMRVEYHPGARHSHSSHFISTGRGHIAGTYRECSQPAPI